MEVVCLLVHPLWGGDCLHCRAFHFQFAWSDESFFLGCRAILDTCFSFIESGTVLLLI